MSPVNWIMNEAYWLRVDYIVSECARRGIACFVTPAYTGYGGGSDGWLDAYVNTSDAALRSYGAALARRFTQGNVVWVLGGDDANDNGAVGAYGGSSVPQRSKQWQIVLGIRSVRQGDLVTGHTARNGHGGVNGEAFKAWGSTYAGFNLNNTYGHDDTDDAVALAAGAYSRSPAIPFFFIEGGYENTDGSDDNGRVAAIQTVLGGGLAGWFAGHDVLWSMGSSSPDTSGATSVLSKYLVGSWSSHANFGRLLKAYAWWTLLPRTDSGLVTSTLLSGRQSIVPAVASDGRFAMIFSPGSGFSVNLGALSIPSVRARWYDVVTGTFSAVTGGPFANIGVRTFAPPGERILVLDGA
jgi:Protein of unknown function (DUF4038)/Putative collagen-binding domain of a collagenase